MSETGQYRPEGAENELNHPQGQMKVEMITAEEALERYGIRLEYNRPVDGAMERARQDMLRRQKMPGEEREMVAREAAQRAGRYTREMREQKRREGKRRMMAVFLGVVIAVGGVVYTAQERTEEAKASIGIQEEIEQTQDKIEQNSTAAVPPDPEEIGATPHLEDTLLPTGESEDEIEAQTPVPPDSLISERSPAEQVSEPNNFSEESPELPDYSMLDKDLQYSIETDVEFLERAKEIMGLIEQYDDWEAAQALAIAVAENRTLNPRAQNTANDNGSTDSGLFQINSVHGYGVEELFDPALNVEVAHNIWKAAGGSFSPWSTHDGGVDEKFLNFYPYLKQLE